MTTASRPVTRERPLPLTRTQLATTRAGLIEALADQRASYEHNEALSTSLASDTDDSDREMARVAADLARDAVAEIELALARLADGTYGMCDACERPIPFERLEAIPQARHCVACAAQAA